MSKFSLMAQEGAKASQARRTRMWVLSWCFLGCALALWVLVTVLAL